MATSNFHMAMCLFCLSCVKGLENDQARPINRLQMAYYTLSNLEIGRDVTRSRLRASLRVIS